MGKKNIPIQDVDETDSNLLQYPHKSKKQAALETAGVTASSILSDEVPAVKPADEREGIMEENLITTADAAEIISEILGAKKVSSRVKTSDNVTAGGEMQADIPPSSEEYAAMSNEDFAKLPPPSIVGKEIFGIVSITRSDVDKIAALSSDEKLALKIKINQLDLRKVLPPDRKDGFCCPICGNGSGKDGDGIVPTLTTDEQGNQIFIHHCFKNNDFEGPLTAILDKETGKDYNQTLAIGLKLLDLAESSTVQPPPPNTFKSKKEYSEEQLAKWQKDIVHFLKMIEGLPLDDMRGLSIDTFKHFHCGYDPFARRIIIPSTEHFYNAILINSERKKFQDAGKEFVKNLNRGSKVMFNTADIVPNKPVIVVEGEIDAMSIWQAMSGNINIIALCGTSNYKKLLAYVYDKISTDDRKNFAFVVMLDNDKAGRDTAKLLTDNLINLGCLAVDKILVTTANKIDANDILQSQGDETLKAIIEQILADANKEFEELRENVSGKDNEDAEFVKKVLYYHQTDAGNAERFLEYYLYREEKTAYLADIGRWAIYEPPIWKVAADKSNTIVASYFLTMARDLQQLWKKESAKLEKRLNEKADKDTPDNVRALKKFTEYFKSLENRKKYSPALETAKSFYNLNFSDMDQKHNFLNTPSGVIDLCTGKLYPHKASYHFTQCTDAEYCAGYRNEMVETILAEILPDEETRTAVLRYFGYCLTGSIREEKALFIYGSGGNGKSTLIQLLQNISGFRQNGYATSIRVDSLLQASYIRDGNAPTPEFAKLEGKRLAVADEVPPERKLDEGVFKSLTGGDYITARRLNCDPTVFEPHFKLIISGNHLPKISNGTDYSLRRRIMVAEFPQQFTDETRDVAIKSFLNSPEAKCGFLSKLVEESVKWYREGLIESAAMKETKSAWLDITPNGNDAEIDYATELAVYQFLDQYCDLAEEGKIKRLEMYAKFRYHNPNIAITDDNLKKAILSYDENISYINEKRPRRFEGLSWKLKAS